jgi:hypothetical protein
MMNIVRGSALGLGAIVFAMVLAPAANAGCGEGVLKQDSSWRLRPDYSTAPLQLASFLSPSIVGLWYVKFISGGKLFDFGYNVWHSDGTEIFNSGGRAPATQNFCMGVWKKTGASSYKLLHPTFSYDASTGKLNARVTLHETVTLAAGGNSFHGTFTIDVYDPTAGTKLLQQVTGTITASRVTVD